MTLRVYTASWCQACKTELPKIREAANKLGVAVQITDVDRCDVKKHPRCATIEFVPTVYYKGREVSVPELQKMAGL